MASSGDSTNPRAANRIDSQSPDRPRESIEPASTRGLIFDFSRPLADSSLEGTSRSGERSVSTPPFQFSASSLPNSKPDEPNHNTRSSPQPASQRSTSSPFQFTPHDFREGSPNPFEYRPSSTELSSHHRAPSLTFQPTLEGVQDGPNQPSPSSRNSPRPLRSSSPLGRSRSPSHRTSRSVSDVNTAFKGSENRVTRDASTMDTDMPQNSFQRGPSLSPFSTNEISNSFGSLDISRERGSRSGIPSKPPPVPFGRSSLSPSRSPEAVSVLGRNSLSPRGSQSHIQIYDPSAELMPSHKYYFPQFQRWLDRAKVLASDIALELEKHENLDINQAARLRTNAKQLATLGAGVTRSVAILGDSGTGKSSLINSLLNFPGLAKASGRGEAVTSVVTEFRYKSDDNPSPFKFEMEFCDKNETEKLLKELVWSYRRLYIPDLDAQDADFRQIENESAIAWSSLSAAFGHHAELSHLCGRNTEATEEEIVARLLTWTKDLNWPSDDGRFEAFVDTANSCRKMTEDFMEDQFWPFIKVVRIYVKSPILNTGLVLVDLPGTRDINLAKVQATEEYLLRADHIFVIARIDRAASNRSLHDSLLGALKQHVPNQLEENGATKLNVTIVCTHSEPSHNAELEQLKEEYTNSHRKAFEDLERQREYAIRNSDYGSEKLVEQQLKYLVMQARNNDVIMKLQNAYVKQRRSKTDDSQTTAGNNPTEDPKLEVFCVANAEYKECSRNGNVLGVNASGIPALRRRCYLISADAAYLEAKNSLRSILPGLLESVKLWIDVLGGNAAKRQEERREGQEVVTHFATSIHRLVATFEEQLKSSFQENISALLHHRIDFWERAGLEQSKEWATKAWHHTSYRAWCRNDGTHSTTAQGHRRWNNELIWKMRLEVLAQWELFETEISDGIKKIVLAVKDTLLQLALAFKERKTFSEAIRLQIANVEYQLSVVEASAKQQAKQFLQKIIEDNHTSFVLDAMRPAYRSATLQAGVGSHDRRKEIIGSKVKNSLFDSISANVSDGGDKLITTICQYVERALAGALRKIEADFDVAYASTTVDENGVEQPECAEQAAYALEAKWKVWQEEMEAIKGGVATMASV